MVSQLPISGFVLNENVLRQIGSTYLLLIDLLEVLNNKT